MTVRSQDRMLPQGPVTRSPLGQLFNFARNPLSFLIELSAQYGDLVHFKIRTRDVFLVSHPDEIEGVLVTHARNFVKNPGFQTIKRVLGEGLLSSEGEFHLRQRRMIQPAFHRQQVAAYTPIMVEEAQKVSERWQSGSQIDIFQEMIALTLQIVSRSLFGTELGGQTREVSQAVEDAMSLFHQATSPFSMVLSRLPVIGDRRFRRGRERLDATLLDIIQHRRENSQDTDDLLSRLIQAQAEGGRAPMTDTQVRDEALTLLLAGHETTATGLAWTWYLLAQHPDAEARLHAELDSVLQRQPPALDDLARLPYTRQVLAESLRLYPPIYMVGRQALQDYPIRNFVIPAGSSLILSPYLVHHDPRWYSDPERFDPQRWLPEARAGQPRLSYLPFGAGPRGCIGEPFAWQEAVIALAVLAQRWKVHLAPGASVETLPRVTLRPKGGIPAVVELRG